MKAMYYFAGFFEYMEQRRLYDPKIYQEIVGWITFLVVVCIIGIIICAVWLYHRWFFTRKIPEIHREHKKHIEDCNEFNAHVQKLCRSLSDYVAEAENGTLYMKDTGQHSYKRSYLDLLEQDNGKTNIMNCSLSVLRNAREKPFAYFCKYFGVPKTEESIQKFQSILNDFLAAEDGIEKLQRANKELWDINISCHIPLLIRLFWKNDAKKALSIYPVAVQKDFYPHFIFRYISGAGYSAQEYGIIFDTNEIKCMIEFLESAVQRRNTIAGQRALMTPSLRAQILYEEGYTCKKCHNSTAKEPNLLLEIDHIVPLSKGGKTERDNLQVLCWRCNRQKGAKLV